jgi:hypothetical protein
MANDYESLVARWHQQADYHEAAADMPQTGKTNREIFREVADVLRRVARELEQVIEEHADA